MKNDGILSLVTVYASIVNGGDGSVFVRWHLNYDTALAEQESDDEGWGEPCIEAVETYVGSSTYKKAT